MEMEVRRRTITPQPPALEVIKYFYRVFKLDMTYFKVQDGQLKLTSKLKKGVASHLGGWDI